VGKRCKCSKGAGLSQNSTDPRVQRTQRSLQEALIDLLAEKNFDAITVGDISRRAVVNRATFYRHYTDKFDLATSILTEVAAQTVAALGPPSEHVANTNPETPPEAWVALFEHIREHARFYHAILGRSNDSWFAAQVRYHLMKVIRERLAAVKDVQRQSHIPEEVALALICEFFMSTIRWWLEQREPYPSRQMATWFLHFIIYGYFHSLGFE
jgi:AcrR family transcriptional regulator